MPRWVAVMVLAILVGCEASVTNAPSSPHDSASWLVMSHPNGSVGDRIVLHGDCRGSGVLEAVASRDGRPFGHVLLGPVEASFRREVIIPAATTTFFSGGPAEEILRGDTIGFRVGSCASRSFLVQRAPSLTFSPASGPVGTLVTLRGRDCRSTSEQDVVKVAALVYPAGSGGPFGSLILPDADADGFVLEFRIPLRALEYHGVGGGPLGSGDTLRFRTTGDGCDAGPFWLTD